MSHPYLVCQCGRAQDSRKLLSPCSASRFNDTAPSIPVDVLLVILEHADKATLVKMCKLNKVCRSYSQDVLYREIRVSQHSEFGVYQTLAQSTHLARRVRSFKTPHNDDYPDLQGALQNMINLRRLDLGYSNIFNLLDLEGCTFTLVSFSCGGSQFQPLYQFLLGQPSLTSLSLMIYRNIDDWPKFGATCLPNITRVAAQFSKLPQLIPNRPVKEVISLGSNRTIIPVDLSFFTLSNSPIQKLSIDYSYLYPKSGQYLTSIFSSLTTLEITVNNGMKFPAIVRDPLIIIIYP
jgi:Leucine-rich repeat (LRR) protein